MGGGGGGCGGGCGGYNGWRIIVFIIRPIKEVIIVIVVPRKLLILSMVCDGNSLRCG